MPLLRASSLALCLTAVFSTIACGEPRQSRGAAAFDGARAFRDLKALVALGPRPTGSEGAMSAQHYIESELRRSGVKVETLRFPLSPPLEGEGADILGVLDGTPKSTVLFITHFDTKRSSNRKLVEANAAASGPALLLELARNAATRRRSSTIVFAFVDASQPLGDSVTDTDGLAGSRALVRDWDASGRLATVRAVVLVESVADPDLQLANEAATGADERLTFTRAVHGVDLSSTYDLYKTIRVHSDQDPFLLRGVAHVYTILDPAHGGLVPPGELRGTPLDDISNVSETTLSRVGALADHLLRDLSDSE